MLNFVEIASTPFQSRPRGEEFISTCALKQSQTVDILIREPYEIRMR